jgi:3-methyl-2-oxobutanoate hydroxymethyltransferase
MQEGGAKIVKLEANAKQIGIVEFLASHDIPVCAHLGLRPQSVHKVGGFRIQGREQAAADQMVADAKALEAVGADMILVEQVPSKLGGLITKEVHVPVIGIGAGPDVDGQILVLYDVLDVTPGHKPRFVRNFMTGVDSPLQALKNYVQAVKDGSYPAPEHCY